MFYAQAPTRLNYDWFVQFHVKDRSVSELRLRYVGWREADVVFQRAAKQE